MLFQLIKQDSLKRFTEVRVIEVFHGMPETVIRKPAFGKEAMDMRIPLKGTSKGMKDANKTRNKIFGFVQGEKELFDNIGNSLKEAVEQGAVFQEKTAEGIVNGEDEVPVCTVDQFKGHSSRPVVGVFGTTGRTKLGVASKRNKLEGTAMGTAIHGAAVRGIAAVDDLFNIFQDDRSGF